VSNLIDGAGAHWDVEPGTTYRVGQKKKIQYPLTDISKINFIKYSDLFISIDSRYNSSIVKEFERGRREHRSPAGKRLSGAIY
jgi:hypothetical protein